MISYISPFSQKTPIKTKLPNAPPKSLPPSTSASHALVSSFRYPSSISPLCFGAKINTSKAFFTTLERVSQELKEIEPETIFLNDGKGLKLQSGKIILPKQTKAFNDALNDVLCFIPEFKELIGKKLPFPHKYTLDGHLLMTAQEVVNDPAYHTLSEPGKRVLLTASLLHDIVPPQQTDRYGENHHEQSANKAKPILERLPFTEKEKQQAYMLIKHHHWDERVYWGELSPENFAKKVTESEDFELLKIMARANLEATGHKATINKNKDSWKHCAHYVNQILDPFYDALKMPPTTFNYPKTKPSQTDGYYHYQYEPGFVNDRSQFIGETAYIEYEDEDGKPHKAIGTVSESHNAVWTLHNFETNKRYHINTNDCEIKDIWLKPNNVPLEDKLLCSPSPIHHLEVVSECKLHPLNTKHDVNKTMTIIKDFESVFGIIQSQNHGEPFVITGNMSVVEPIPGYEVLQIETHTGETYQFDLNYTDQETFIGISTVPTQKLESFRMCHGKPISIIDEARQNKINVVNKLVDGIYTNKISPFENEELYNYLSTDIAQTEKLIQQWYGEKIGKKLIKKVEENLDKKHLVLLADPGIASRINEFLAFCTSTPLKCNDLTPFSLRKAFSDHLGSVKVYREMALEDTQAAFIKHYGLLAPGVLDDSSTKENLFHLLDTKTRRNKEDTSKLGYYTDQMIARVDSGWNNDDIYTSCSAYKDVAASIGWYSQKRGKNDAHPYLIELNIPKIATLEQKNLFDSLSDLPNRIGETFSVGKDNIFRSDDPNVELFIPFVVSPECFTIQKTEPPLRWYGSVSERYNMTEVTDE